MNKELLNAPGCERIKDFYNVGPIQRANVESFFDAIVEHLAAGECVEPDCHATGVCVRSGLYVKAAARVRIIGECAKLHEELAAKDIVTDVSKEASCFNHF